MSVAVEVPGAPSSCTEQPVSPGTTPSRAAATPPQNRTGPESVASTENQAAGPGSARTHDATSAVLPPPPPATTGVGGRGAGTAPSRSVREVRGRACGRGGGAT